MSGALPLDSKPACDGYDPEIFFPEPTRDLDERMATTEKAALALSLCARCPVQKECLDLTMADRDRLGWGISGGTFPYERLEAIGQTRKAVYDYQRRMRSWAQEAKGLTCPPIPDQKQDFPRRRLFQQYYSSVLGL